MSIEAVFCVSLLCGVAEFAFPAKFATMVGFSISEKGFCKIFDDSENLGGALTF
jgi:hypothetical protein